jgi:hypothetical protein
MKPNVYWATNADDISAMKQHLSERMKRDVVVTDLGSIGYEQYHYFKF